MGIVEIVEALVYRLVGAHLPHMGAIMSSPDYTCSRYYTQEYIAVCLYAF